MDPRGFDILEHPADIGFRAYAGSLPELYANAAYALLAVAGDPTAAQPLETWHLTIESSDPEALMVDWLNEILYCYDGRRLALCRFHVAQPTPTRLEAAVSGEPRDPERHRARLIVKAVTWHQFKIEQRGDRWVAEVFVDI